MLSAKLNNSLISNPQGPELTPFQLIYQYAKMPNKVAAETAIRKILQTGISIDVFDGTEYHRPVSKLAAEGDQEAVKFLKERFNASDFWIAQGYAQGGFTELWKRILANNPTLKIKLLLEIAIGLGRGNKPEYNYLNFIEDYPETKDNIFFIQLIIQGLAISGFFDDCKLLQEMYPDANLLNNELNGAIIGRHVIRYNEILTTSTDVTRFEHAIRTLATTNQVEEFESLFKSHQHLKNLAIIGFAFCGNMQYCQKLMQQFPEHKAQLLQSQTMGLCWNTQFAALDTLLIENPSERPIIIKEIIKQLSQHGFHNFNSYLKILATFSEQNANELVNEFVIEEFPQSQRLELAETRKHMKRGLTFEQGRAWNDPYVRAFFTSNQRILNYDFLSKFPKEIFSLISEYLALLNPADTGALLLFAKKEKRLEAKKLKTHTIKQSNEPQGRENPHAQIEADNKSPQIKRSHIRTKAKMEKLQKKMYTRKQRLTGPGFFSNPVGWLAHNTPGFGTIVDYAISSAANKKK